MENCSGLIYLFETLSKKYCRRYKLSYEKFIEIADKYKLFKFIQDNRVYFNDTTDLRAVIAIHNYVMQQEYSEHQVTRKNDEKANFLE